MNFDIKEKTDIVTWYFTGNSLRTVRRLFAEKYPEQRVPCTRTISRLVEQFKKTGSLETERARRVAPPRVLTEEVRLDILCCIENNPKMTLEQVAKECNVSRSSVYRVYNTKHKVPNEELILGL